jgi:hypothetical protein
MIIVACYPVQFGESALIFGTVIVAKKVEEH